MQQLVVLGVVQAVQKVVAPAQLHQFLLAHVELFAHGAQLLQLGIVRRYADDALHGDVGEDGADAGLERGEQAFAQLGVACEGFRLDAGKGIFKQGAHGGLESGGKFFHAHEFLVEQLVLVELDDVADFCRSMERDLAAQVLGGDVRLHKDERELALAHEDDGDHRRPLQRLACLLAEVGRNAQQELLYALRPGNAKILEGILARRKFARKHTVCKEQGLEPVLHHKALHAAVGGDVAFVYLCGNLAGQDVPVHESRAYGKIRAVRDFL